MGHESRGAPLAPLNFDLILAFGHEALPSGVAGVDPDLVDLTLRPRGHQKVVDAVGVVGFLFDYLIRYYCQIHDLVS